MAGAAHVAGRRTEESVVSLLIRKYTECDRKLVMDFYLGLRRKYERAGKSPRRGGTFS